MTDKKIFRGLYILTLFNWMTLLFLILIEIFDSTNNLFDWNSSYADYKRTDLAYLLVQGNFGNPWEFHPEIPALQNMPYLPLPFVLLKVFGVRLEYYHPNAPYIWIHIIIGVVTFAILMFQAMSKLQTNTKFLFVVGFIIPSVPLLYFFNTGNIQIWIVSLVLLTLIPVKKITMKKSLFLLAFLGIATTKPQFVISLMGGIKNRNDIIKVIYIGVFSVLLSLLGFMIFTGNLNDKLNYWLKSLGVFTNPEPNFLVHNNASLIGNLLALEMRLRSKSSDFFIYDYKNIIVLLLIGFIAYLLVIFYKRMMPSYFSFFALVTFTVIVPPLTYAYNYLLFSAPLALMLVSLGNREKITLNIFERPSTRRLIYLSLFLMFSPKPIRVDLILGYSDTNLYTMLSAFGPIIFLGVLLHSTSQANNTNKPQKSR